MEILFLGGFFPLEEQSIIIKKSKNKVEYAANIFQWNLINGLKEQYDNISLLSAPFVGTYPKDYSDVTFKGFQNDVDNIYVNFINLWGIRNYFRANALKRRIKQFALMEAEEKAIIVYCPHNPFLQAALYAKKIDPRVHISLIVPDLPQYMNLTEGKHRFYSFLKKYDIKLFNMLSKKIDSFVILTEQMKELLKIGTRPYIVVEGLVDINNITPIVFSDNRNIVYTGTLNKKFGVMDLVRAFRLIKDDTLNLIICGEGEAKSEIMEFTNKDKRIKFLGQVDIQTSRQFQKNAAVLVNPRKNNEEYTKYSFPSKNLEYLSTGKPVVAYKLDGITEEYDKYMNYVQENTIESLASTIEKTLLYSHDEILEQGAINQLFLKERKNNVYISRLIVQMIRGEK